MRFSRKGSMLVMALWTLSLLSVFAVSLGLGVRQKAALLGRLTTLDAVYPIAYSGVEKAKSLVRSDGDPDVDMMTDVWAIPSEEEAATEVAGGSFTLAPAGRPRVVDEERKINLNRASVEVVVRLFQNVSGIGNEISEELVYNLMDWMDSDSFFGHPQYGAEADYYENLKYPYTAKNKPYELMDELLLVKGMTPARLEKLRPYVTVYGSGQVNVNTAGPEVLAAIGFSHEGVGMITRFRSGPDGVEGTSDDLFFSNVNAIQTDIAARGTDLLPANDVVLLAGLIGADRIGVRSTVFSVTSRGVLEKNGVSVEVEAVFNRRGETLYEHAKEIQWPARS